MPKTDKLAKIIWNYMLMAQQPSKCDAIFTLCSIDDRVAQYAARLYLEGYGDLLIFSGGIAHQEDLKRLGLELNWPGTEAEHFAEIAIKHGVPKEKILIENQATNTGENIRFTYSLLKGNQLEPRSLLLVQKPYMERRTFATFKAQWPGSNTKIIVTSPPIKFDNYFNGQNPKDIVINIMVGDLQRIKEYPKLGFQIEQDIPSTVWDAYHRLRELGFTKYSISN